MSGNLRISVRAGERIFINGAVIKVDRKVSLELLNDVVFLLEQHVMKPEDTTTPLRQLYFMIQMMLMDPSLHMKAMQLAMESIDAQMTAYTDATILTALREVSACLASDKPLDALKKVRAAIPAEDLLLKAAPATMADAKEVA